MNAKVAWSAYPLCGRGEENAKGSVSRPRGVPICCGFVAMIGMSPIRDSSWWSARFLENASCCQPLRVALSRLLEI